MSLKVLFTIQGEGRGHMTQAIALAEILQAAGHEVVAACVGRGSTEALPAFLEERIGASMQTHLSPVIKLKSDARSIDVWDTTLSASRLVPTYLSSIRSMEETIQACQPDLIVNFFEPLLGLVAMRTVDMPPVVCIAHQYMFFHPSYPFSGGTRMQRQGVMMFTKLAAAGASRLLALSLYPADPLPERHVTVVPPLLRKELFDLIPGLDPDPFLLVYVWRKELLDEIVNWSRNAPRLRVECFLDRSGKSPREEVNSFLALNELDDRLFLERMAKCSGLATTAGFETTAEAMVLGKPLLMVPTHVEQQCNALDAARLGAGRMSRIFDLDQLLGFSVRDHQSFRDWTSSADDIYLEELESVVFDRVAAAY